MGKYHDLWQKNKEASSSSGDSGSSLPKLPWFYPNKAIEASENGTYIIRVLPIEGKNTWYYEFKKHSFKAGSWKNCICLDTKGKDGEPVGKCPICEFLDMHKDELQDNDFAKKQLAAKTSFGLMIYDYQDKKIKRLELNWYGFNDILAAIVESDDEEFEELIDTEGFNLYYKKDENGYSAVHGVKKGKRPVAEIKESLGITEIPSVEEYTLPKNVGAIEKILSGMVDLVIENGLVPEVDSESKPAKKKKAMLDDEEPVMTQKKQKKEPEPDPEEDDLADDPEEVDEAPKPKAEKKKEKEKEKVPEAKPAKTTIVGDDELEKLLDDLDV